MFYNEYNNNNEVCFRYNIRMVSTVISKQEGPIWLSLENLSLLWWQKNIFTPKQIIIFLNNLHRNEPV